MTEPSNFRLKDGRTITIDNKDVQRIRILNDIVWEKTKEIGNYAWEEGKKVLSSEDKNHHKK